MGEAFILRRGSKADAYAVIGVTFPFGSTVTCVKNGVSLKANGSGTNVYFNVPEAGNWVVTITSGGKTKSQTVTIGAAGQVEKIALDYGLTLFDNGTGKENWSTAADVGGTASIGDTLHLFGNRGNDQTASSVGWAYTTQALSFSGKTSLSVVASTTINVAGLVISKAGHAQVRVVEESENYSASPAAASDLTEGSGATTTLNISGLDATKKYRVVFMASGGYITDGDPGSAEWLTTTVDVTSVTVT